MCVHEKPAESSLKVPSVGPGGRANVARYDDDYPLLFGEPAVQPQWSSVGGASGVISERTAQTGNPSCRSCGQCRRP
jgi:hypothetical protein